MEIKMRNPKFCNHCKWTPAIKNNPEQVIARDKQWVVFPIPNSAIWLFICPKCFNVMANINVIENIEKIEEFQRQQKEAENKAASSRIIIPGR